MSDIDICNVFKMIQEFKLIKNLVLKNFSKFLYKKQKRFVLNLERPTILTNEKKNLTNEESTDKIKRKVKDIMEDDLTESNRYLLAAIF